MDEPVVVSSFFSLPSTFQAAKKYKTVEEEFLRIIDHLNNSLESLKLPPSVQCIYNSTIYARITFEMYVRTYCNTPKLIMYFGMNPGPWGMSQTGVPFGEVSHVRDWLKIEGCVEKPENEIPARPVRGFACSRSEISGSRFWGLFKKLCGTPDNFFKTSFVYNYLPQQWMKMNGCNITPNDFKVSEMKPLYDICDPIFVDVLKLYEVKIIVAVGKFCETRAIKAIKKYLPASDVKVLYIQHPSPRIPNNVNWELRTTEALNKLNLLQYYIQNQSEEESCGA